MPRMYGHTASSTTRAGAPDRFKNPGNRCVAPVALTWAATTGAAQGQPRAALPGTGAPDWHGASVRVKYRAFWADSGVRSYGDNLGEVFKANAQAGAARSQATYAGPVRPGKTIRHDNFDRLE